MIDRELYLPESWTKDPERCRAARVPERIGFRTKPELARVMLERALDAGVPASWVTADEVYGGNPALRRWLEGRGVWHVLAVKCTELLAVDGPMGPVRQSAEQLAAPAAAGMTRWLPWWPGGPRPRCWPPWAWPPPRSRSGWASLG